jgi:thymidylate synthase (FAD)
MPRTVDIGIFCIGRTQVDRAEVERWLGFLGVQDFNLPSDEAVTNPALLIALAAKRCYKSFDTTLNPNLSRVRTDYAEYLDNVMKSGHGSVLEHSVFNFAIENVSRVFTAEMNRHRAGWAISEGSLRYIRFGESIDYWLPDSIKGPDVLDDLQLRNFHEHDLNQLEHEMVTGQSPAYAFDDVDEKRHATRIIMERAFYAQESAYRVLERIWKDELAPDSKFKAKKEITSMMRRIVGLGVATGGVWSGNIRALRHVLTMRCDPAAEEEMLHVFSRIAMTIKEKEPLMFGDFYQDDDGFWRPKYRKI